METKFITIQEASELSNKSIQTIRRAIKAKKVHVRKLKTPQGFNYMIDYSTLCSTYGLNADQSVKTETVSENNEVKEDITSSKNEISQEMISAEDFKNFTKILEKMVSQHSDERQNFMRLVNTLQEKIFVLENQVNLLKAPSPKWYQIWK
jgi:hypothetical protein